jgi:hypothetical protein
MCAVSADVSCAADPTATVAGLFAETATLAPAHASSDAPMNNAFEKCIPTPSQKSRQHVAWRFGERVSLSFFYLGEVHSRPRRALRY